MTANVLLMGGEIVKPNSTDTFKITRSKKCDTCSTCLQTDLTEEDYCVFQGSVKTESSGEVENWQACRDLCRADTDCKVATFDHVNKNCAIRTQLASQTCVQRIGENY